MWVRALFLSALLLAGAPHVAAAAGPPPGSSTAVLASGAAAQKLGAQIDAYLEPYVALDLFQGCLLYTSPSPRDS